MRLAVKFLFTTLTAIVAVGCIPSAPPKEDENQAQTPVPTPGEVPGAAKVDEEKLVAEWNDLAKNQDAARRTGRHKEIAYTLLNQRPEALFPIIDVMGEQETPADVRVFAVETLSMFMQPAHVDKLAGLLDAKYKPTTRACATSLLGTISDPRVGELLQSVSTDPERRVRFSALLGLCSQGDKEARRSLVEMYSQSDTTAFEKVQIVQQVLKDAGHDDLALLADSLLVPELDSLLKGIVVTNLGRIGDATVVDSLRKSKDVVNEKTYGETVDAAIKVIEERIAAAPAAPATP